MLLEKELASGMSNQDPIHEERNAESDHDQDSPSINKEEEIPKYDGPGYAVIHRGQKPTPKPMPEPPQSQR